MNGYSFRGSSLPFSFLPFSVLLLSSVGVIFCENDKQKHGKVPIQLQEPATVKQLKPGYFKTMHTALLSFEDPRVSFPPLTEPEKRGK